MATLHAFDRIRIQHHIDQLTELVRRKEVMVYWEVNSITRAQLEADIVQHRADIASYQTQLQS